jgi:hypothetical protein
MRLCARGTAERDSPFWVTRCQSQLPTGCDYREAPGTALQSLSLFGVNIMTIEYLIAVAKSNLAIAIFLNDWGRMDVEFNLINRLEAMRAKND